MCTSSECGHDQSDHSVSSTLISNSCMSYFCASWMEVVSAAIEATTPLSRDGLPTWSSLLERARCLPAAFDSPLVLITIDRLRENIAPSVECVCTWFRVCTRIKHSFALCSRHVCTESRTVSWIIRIVGMGVDIVLFWIGKGAKQQYIAEIIISTVLTCMCCVVLRCDVLDIKKL